MTNSTRPRKKTLRCAIYTRKSTEEGLDQEFNSLEAQREAGENYIAAQKREGWRCLKERYDDGGFTGGNMDRPALRELMDEVRAGRVDCVVVYKVDRLSRSLLDFARIMEVFEQHEVDFVSVTQQLHTGSSMGRLMLNVLFSFAQFERELISERTRDKMGAARRKGKRVGGRPLLGYDVDPHTKQLVVNPDEAERVRAIFELYLKHRSLDSTVHELNRRSWKTKRHTTRKGTTIGDRPFNKARLHALLTNVTYRGQVAYQGQVYAGEQEAIVPEGLFDQVRERLESRRHEPRHPRVTERVPGLLEDLLWCARCQRAMRHTYTSKGSRRYRYYVCRQSKDSTTDGCRAGSVPAAELEEFVWNEVAKQNTLPDRETLTQAQQIKRLQDHVQRVDYDGNTGDLTIGLNELLQENA